MKIDDIIRKCIEIPGISIKRSDFSAELLMKTKDGKGSMTFFCKLRSNGMPVPLLRNGYSIFNGTKYR